MTGKVLIEQIIDNIAPKPAGKLFASYKKRRAEAARDILFKKVSANEIDMLLAAQEDETIGVIYQYMQCAARGTARLNLNLLAQAIKGDIEKGQLYPDNFTKHLNTLASLTYDEIFLLGRYWNHIKIALSQEELKYPNRKEPNLDVFFRTSSFAKDAKRQFIDGLVPQFFKTRRHIEIILSTLTRTGLFTLTSTETGFDGVDYRCTLRLIELCQLVDFERALEEEKEY